MCARLKNLTSCLVKHIVCQNQFILFPEHTVQRLAKKRWPEMLRGSNDHVDIEVLPVLRCHRSVSVYEKHQHFFKIKKENDQMSIA